MNSTEARVLFPALLGGTLDDRERAELLGFVGRVPLLRREVDRLAELFDRAGEDAVAPPPSVWSAIEAEIERDTTAVEDMPNRPRRREGSFRSRHTNAAADLSSNAASSHLALSHADLLFGKIALNWRLVTRDLLNRALLYQRTQSPAKPLGAILLEKGILNSAQVSEIRAYQVRIGKIVASKVDERSPVPDSIQHGTHSGAVAVAQGDPKPDPYDSDALLGQKLGGCVIFALLGAGGMGRVYLAHHESLRKDVVVKVLPAELAANSHTVERFLREARSAAGLEHPNVVAVHDIGVNDEGLHYIVMQYVDGPSVEDLIATQGASEPAKALALISQAADGLAAAHDSGIFHRDIKPDNLLLTASGTLKIADFGLAKDLNAELRLTADGCMIGTPLYMAPEIGRVKEIDGRIDIYSLGVVFYYLLTGVQPFRGFSALEILSGKAHDQLRPPEQHSPDLSDDYRRVLGKMLVKDRDRRYGSVSALRLDLDRLRRGQKVDVALDESPWGPRCESLPLKTASKVASKTASKTASPLPSGGVARVVGVLVLAAVLIAVLIGLISG